MGNYKARAWCIDCEKRAYPRISHFKNCSSACRLCYRFGWRYPCRSKQQRKGILCKRCNFIFPTKSCYRYHKEQSTPGSKPFRSICENRRICRQCRAVIYKRSGKKCNCKRDNNNTSDVETCRRCGIVHTEADPYCYIQPLDDDGIANHDRTRYVFYDIETTQSKRVGKSVHQHRPILLVAEVLCVPCIDSQIDVDSTDPANDHRLQRARKCCCGVFGRRFRFSANSLNGNPRRLVFHDFDDNVRTNCVDAFLNFLLNSGCRKTQTLVMAHNGKSVCRVLKS